MQKMIWKFFQRLISNFKNYTSPVSQNSNSSNLQNFLKETQQRVRARCWLKYEKYHCLKEFNFLHFFVAPQVAVSRFKTPVAATLNGKAVDSSDVMANSSTVYIYQTYTCKEAPAVFVSGSVTSFNDASGDITLQLIPEGLSEPAYETIVTGNTVDYYFADVAAGTYTLKVMKKNHVTREYTVVVGNSSVIQDVYLCLLGDVNEDGLLNSADYSMIVAHVKCNVVFDDVQKSAADLTRDGVVDAFDAIYLDLYLNGAVELPQLKFLAS